MRESAVQPSPLPPSVEKAYHQKCIDLKRRLREVEDSNDAARQRLHRLNRAIMKMRVNRAFLMDRLSKMQELKDYESDQSSTGPPTPEDVPARARRANRRRSPRSPDRSNLAPSSPPAASAAHDSPSSHYHESQHGAAPQSIASNHHASPSQTAHHTPRTDHRSPGQQSPYQPQHEPLIHSLPNGTSVMLVAPGVPKPAPWRISELDPRHHVKPDFEGWTLDEQEDSIFNDDYLPFDVYGSPVLVEYEPRVRKYVHVLPKDPRWRNPVVDSMRKDTKESRKRVPRPPPGPESEDTYMSSEAPHADEEGRMQSAAGGFTAANR